MIAPYLISHSIPDLVRKNTIMGAERLDNVAPVIYDVKPREIDSRKASDFD